MIQSYENRTEDILMAQSDNIPAMLQSGEYVVRKEAVDK